MTAIMLSAGNATRLGGECKALTTVGRYTMLEWWRRLHLERPVVVCRSEHEHQIDAPTVACDIGGGPAVALYEAMHHIPVAPVTVVYADTWVPVVPTAEEFCGVAAAAGGRCWNVVEPDGRLAYRHVPAGEAALVDVGLYRFDSAHRLIDTLELCIDSSPGNTEVGMAEVVNAYGLPYVPVVGWQDVGDPEAKARWRLL